VAKQARPVSFLGNEALLVSGTEAVWTSAAGPGVKLAGGSNAYSALAEPGRTVLNESSQVRELGADGGVRWARGFGGFVSSVALLADGGTLVVAQPGGGDAVLWAVDPTGTETLSCPLPGTASGGTPAGGLWFALVRKSARDAVVAFEAPVGELAPRGWVTPSGSPSNDRRPR
jgi:hypothetical protein